MASLLIRLSMEGRRWVVDALHEDTLTYERIDWCPPETIEAHLALRLTQDRFRDSFVYVDGHSDERELGAS